MTVRTVTLRTVAVVAVAAVSVTTAYSFRLGGGPGARAAAAARSLVDSLSADQRATAVLRTDSPQRTDWHFVPKDERKGLPLGEMSNEQREQTIALLDAVLSDAGNRKVAAVRTLEAIVRDLEGEGRRWSRDPDAYHLTLFGEPDAGGQWAFSFEGHHVSINVLCRDGVIVATTPQFLGAHPAIVAGDLKANAVGTEWAALRDEAELAFALAASLTDAQREQARTSAKAPAEIRGAGKPQPVEYGDPAGVTGKDLNEDQRRLLSDLIAVYCNVFGGTEAARRMLEIEGLDSVHFSYAGTMSWGEAHGYIVQGPSFVIEYVNSQPDAQGNPANHAHAIYRDLRGDFGIDRPTDAG